MIEGSWENRDVAGALVRSPLLIDMQFYAVFDVCVRVCVHLRRARGGYIVQAHH